MLCFLFVKEVMREGGRLSPLNVCMVACSLRVGFYVGFCVDEKMRVAVSFCMWCVWCVNV